MITCDSTICNTRNLARLELCFVKNNRDLSDDIYNTFVKLKWKNNKGSLCASDIPELYNNADLDICNGENEITSPS